MNTPSLVLAAASTDVLPLVTTPLALAALALMLGTGIMRALLRRRSSPLLQQIVRSVFVLALVFGVLANVGFVATSIWGGDMRMAGSVRDEQGNGLDRVVLEIDGLSRTATLRDGSYELTLPSSRRAEKYEVWATLPGYEPKKETLEGPKLPAVHSIMLKKQRLSVADVFRTPTNFRALHLVGNPIVDFQLAMIGPKDVTTTVTEMSVDLVRADGHTFSLVPGGVFQPGTGVLSPPLSTIELISDRRWDIAYRFVGTRLLPESIATDLMNAWADHTRANLPPADFRISAPLLARLRESEKSAWMWSAGTWKLVLRAAINGNRTERAYSFDLKEEDIRKLEAATDGYVRGENLTLVSTLGQAAGVFTPLREL